MVEFLKDFKNMKNFIILLFSSIIFFTKGFPQTGLLQLNGLWQVLDMPRSSNIVKGNTLSILNKEFVEVDSFYFFFKTPSIGNYKFKYTYKASMYDTVNNAVLIEFNYVCFYSSDFIINNEGDKQFLENGKLYLDDCSYSSNLIFTSGENNIFQKIFKFYSFIGSYKKEEFKIESMHSKNEISIKLSSSILNLKRQNE